MPVPESLAATITFDEACHRGWDVLIVGAGPSGALAAMELARRDVAVLLVDKAEFPRRKVCGCYLNGSALATLSRVGLSDLLEQLSAPRVGGVRLGANGRVAELKLPPGAALSREALDTALVKRAIEAGALFLPGVEAKSETVHDDRCEAALRQASREGVATAKITIVADGVGGQFVRDDPELNYRTAPRSLVGASATTDQIPDEYRPGTIQMAVGSAGYVGCLQLEDGRLDIAAAFDPRKLRETRGPGELAQRIADQSGLPRLLGLESLKWIGTPPLTRKPTAKAAHRLFLIGDAAGYIEPFTGEGISWALATGREIAPLAARAAVDYSPNMIREWNQSHRRLLGARQRLCHWLTKSLRKPRLAQSAVVVLSRFPVLASPFVQLLNRAP